MAATGDDADRPTGGIGTFPGVTPAPRPHGRVRRAAGQGIAVGLAGALVLAVAGCGDERAVGDWWQVPPTNITFPVPWAGTGPGGRPAAGIEAAGIAVRAADEPTFEVNLGDIRAKGAGAQWEASTASAATVATLFTGADPASLSIGYTITGPIDGPSGGAALTVGTIAAIRGDALRPRVVMTGTIAPDGTVGRVGLVPQKLRAAAKDGYRVFLIPVGTQVSFDQATGATVNVKALGRSLGVTVRTVRDINEAYAAFTGKTIAPPVARAAVLTPRARATAVATTRRTLQAARGDLRRTAALVPAAQRALLAAELDEAQRALEGGRPGDAYGRVVDATYRIGRISARARVREMARAEGIDAVRTAITADVRAVLAQADTLVERQSDPAGLRVEQWLSLPSAMGWAVYAQGVLQAMDTALSAPPAIPDEAARLARLADMAAVLEDQRASVDRFGPDAVAMVRASPSRTTVPEDVATRFMDGYSTFLSRAGSNSKALYMTQKAGLDTATMDATDIYPVLVALGDEAEDAAMSATSLRQAITQSAYATTYYVLGTTLVSGDAYGLTGFGLGEEAGRAFTPELLRNAVESGEDLIDGWTAFLQWSGQNMGYPLWQRDWSMGIYEALRGTRREESGATIALNEVWYAVMNNLMVRAASLNLG